MAKIGRNDPCPCGSGSKYKKCCLPKAQVGQPVTPMEQARVSLMGQIEKIQRAAAAGKEKVFEVGVFVFFSKRDGDAWLLEITDSDAVQVAEAGKPLDTPIDENPETIEINWSHTFAIRDKKFYLTSYEDKSESLLPGVPTQQVRAAIRRIRKRYPEELLNQVHIPQENTEAADS